ncbi:ECF-type sigma factor [Rubripirellula sp.]|jgi:RNA polymerase sigma factor (TIGR02999 family)|nr:ECF-type sigma factor [Rubripirellula sp.]MDA9934828.1 ECF-type sigma factor [Rubripirellula sp.]MDB4633930.1 ECF-type sigma factor [Rubripirellula sp.]MDC0251620.1 ECF-type sigma factor [bacterium]MDC0288824.1 ECF-type sigma factor [Rubripirellula sp.]
MYDTILPEEQQAQEAQIESTLADMQEGDLEASADLLPLVYSELRKLAASRLAAEPAGQTLQATALVHEAYLRLTKNTDQQRWNSRGHFFGAASTAMRRILIEQARRKKSLRGGGEFNRVSSHEIEQTLNSSPAELLTLNEALTILAETHPRKAKLVELRFFAGLSNREAAEVLNISTSTADQDWRYARAWLKVKMDGNSANMSTN